MIKAREMLKIAVHDGHLLNFCKLGHLAAMARSFDGSDLEHVDIEKLWKAPEEDDGGRTLTFEPRVSRGLGRTRSTER
jgi:hypothetical protein